MRVAGGSWRQASVGRVLRRRTSGCPPGGAPRLPQAGRARVPACPVTASGPASPRGAAAGRGSGSVPPRQRHQHCYRHRQRRHCRHRRRSLSASEAPAVPSPRAPRETARRARRSRRWRAPSRGPSGALDRRPPPPHYWPPRRAPAAAAPSAPPSAPSRRRRPSPGTDCGRPRRRSARGQGLPRRPSPRPTRTCRQRSARSDPRRASAVRPPYRTRRRGPRQISRAGG